MDEFYNIFIANAEMNVELINLSAEIEAMLDAVKSTQHRPKNSANRISSLHDDIRFSSISEANKYLEDCRSHNFFLFFLFELNNLRKNTFHADEFLCETYFTKSIF